MSGNSLGSVGFDIENTGYAKGIEELKNLGEAGLEANRKAKELTKTQQELTSYFRRMRSEITQVNRQMGMLTGATSDVKRLMNELGETTARSGKNMSRFGMYAQQVGYQVGDFFVQIQSGTNVFVAFGQQATQLAGLLPGLAGAVVGISIAIGTALLSAWDRSRESTIKAKEEVDRYKNALEGLKGIVDELQVSLDKLRFGGLSNADTAGLAEQARLEERIANLKRQQNDLANQMNPKAQAMVGYLQGQINAEQAKLKVLLDERSEADKITAELDKQKKAAIAIKDSLVESASANLAAVFSAASPFAQGLLDKVLAISGAIAGLISFGPSTSVGQLPTGAQRNALSSMYTTSSSPMAPSTSPNPRNAPSGIGGIDWGLGGSPGGGGGGGGGSNPLADNLKAVQDYLKSQADIEMDSYTERQDTLKSALDSKMITLQEYQALEKELILKHNEELSGIDAYKYGNTLTQAQQFFGDMSSALQAGGEKTAKAARVFGAAEALINAYRAASQTLADPTIPFWGKAAAAVSVLATGMGFVNAIKSGSSSGGGGGGSSRGTSTSVQTSQQTTPQTVYLQGLDRNALFSGEMLSDFFEQFYSENDKRGKVFVVAR